MFMSIQKDPAFSVEEVAIQKVLKKLKGKADKTSLDIMA